MRARDLTRYQLRVIDSLSDRYQSVEVTPPAFLNGPALVRCLNDRGECVHGRLIGPNPPHHEVLNGAA